MPLLIRGGRIMDPSDGFDQTGDLYMEDGRIRLRGGSINPDRNGLKVIDARGKTVIPGLVDLHVHLRDPGQTHKEDISSGSMAAARGGVTSMVAMPNTSPVIDSPAHYGLIRDRISEAPVRIYQAGSLTAGQNGREPSDLAGMAGAGIRVFSEDGKSVMDSALCREVFRTAARLKLPVFDHCEDITLRNGGCMNMDANAVRLNLPGISNSVEDVITARDILLARETGLALHLCHMSTAGAVQMLRFARSLGAEHLTGEVCPHHFILSSDDIPADEGNYKMNPPLRTRADVEELIRGLRDGTISAISTDHAPHAESEKKGSMKEAAFGIAGLETSLALSYTWLVEKGVLTLMELLKKMSPGPAGILGIEAGTLREGAPADAVVVDFDRSWTIDPSAFASRGHNTPFAGFTVRGFVCQTICRGRVVWNEEAQ